MGEVAFSSRYNSTVPVYLGCLVMNLSGPHTTWVRDNCHRATGLRRSRSPYRWLCYANHSLREYIGKPLRVTTSPHPVTGAARLQPANLLAVHEDDTVTIRWRNGGQTKRVNKCRIVM